MSDLPDDVTGDQVHVMYVLPSDGSDRQLDVNGAITNSIAAWNGWFTAQTGGSRMRLDTFDGVPDVTFVRLPQTDAAVAATGDDRGQIEADLHALGFNAPGKIYAVYYDGSGEFCGSGAYPPTLVGNVAVLNLQGLDHRVNPPAVCASNPVGADGATPGYFDYSMLHEVVHTLGFVAACAPHISVQAHVDDSNHDLMYSPRTTPAAPWQFPAVLDVGRDDYYHHSIPGCLDLARSAFLTRFLPARSRRRVGRPPARCRSRRIPARNPVGRCPRRSRRTDQAAPTGRTGPAAIGSLRAGLRASTVSPACVQRDSDPATGAEPSCVSPRGRGSVLWKVRRVRRFRSWATTRYRTRRTLNPDRTTARPARSAPA